MTQETNPTQDTPAPKARSGSVQVRMLVDHTETDEDGEKTFYGCNTVQTFSRAKADSLVESGVADDTPAAVARAQKEADAAKK
jgi:hypothetical protein